MAFADLAPNQMVDENNASTGGFTSIGPKLPGNQCYSKSAALAAYQLNASIMDGFASNQLVPKEFWQAPGTPTYPAAWDGSDPFCQAAPPPAFTPYSYLTNVACYPVGPVGQYRFEVEVNVYGAPTWNTIVGGTIQVTQNSSNNTNGIQNPGFVSGTIYQCQSVATFNNSSSVSLTYCSIGLSDGSTTHSHAFSVPISFSIPEITNHVTKTINVNVT